MFWPVFDKNHWKQLIIKWSKNTFLNTMLILHSFSRVSPKKHHGTTSTLHYNPVHVQYLPRYTEDLLSHCVPNFSPCRAHICPYCRRSRYRASFSSANQEPRAGHVTPSTISVCCCATALPHALWSCSMLLATGLSSTWLWSGYTSPWCTA